MKFPTAAAVAVALVASVATSGPAAKSAAAQSRQDFVVLRGADVEIISFQQRRAESFKNIVVLRGKPAPRRLARSNVPAMAVAGDKFWLVDRENDRLNGCRWWKTSTVGSEFIRCLTRRLPY